MIARKTLSIAVAAAVTGSMCMAAPAVALQGAAAQTGTSFAAMATASAGYSLTADQSKRVAIMLDKLTARFAVGGTQASITNSTADAALGLQQLAKAYGLNAASLINADAALGNLQQNKSVAAGALAKYLLVFKAAGMDSSRYSNYVEQFKAGALKLLQTEPTASGADYRVYSAVWILPAAVECCPQETELIEQAVNIIAEKQADVGLVAGDYQTTSQAVWALSFLSSQGTGVSTAVKEQAQAVASKASAAVMSAQLSNGAWPYNTASSAANLETTGWALYVASTYADQSVRNSACAHGLAYMQSAVDSNLAYFTAASPSNEPMSAAAAIWGLSGAASVLQIKADSSSLALPKVTKLKVKSKKAKRVTVSWANAKCKKLRADGYQVRIYKGKKLVKSVSVKPKDDGTIKKTTIKLAKKYRGKKVKVYVRAYRNKTVLHGAIYSPKSATVKVKVK